jgi:hypothetical protein
MKCRRLVDDTPVILAIGLHRHGFIELDHLEVEELHTFFVGASGHGSALVHNGQGNYIKKPVGVHGPSNAGLGNFSIRDWTGYPSGVPKPTGPFQLLEGAEYEAAREAANKANAALRRADPAKYAGKQIHEIQPVKYGGSPTDPANKIALAPQEHAQYTTWWNRLQRRLWQ